MYSAGYIIGNTSPNDPAVGSRFLQVGSKFQMYNSAPGEAMLSELPWDQVATIVNGHRLPGTTENAITDREILFDELEATRTEG